MTHDETQRYLKVEGLERNEVEDGYVVFDEPREQVHFLNVSASAVLELCDGNSDVRSITTLVQQAFALSSAPEADVTDCLASLLKLGLIKPVDPT